MIRMIKSQDFFTGILFVSVAALFIQLTSDYERGTATAMGPGFFPFYLGILLMMVGGTLVLRALRSHAPSVSTLPWKPLAILLALVLLAWLGSALEWPPRSSLIAGSLLAFTLALILGLRSMGLVFLAVSLFSLLLPSLGLICSAALLLALAARASPESRPRELIVSTVLLTSVATLVFIHGLKLPINAWPDTDGLQSLWQQFDSK